MKARAAGLSDLGRCRKVNQDQFLLDSSLGLYAIADGMGGHAAGEVANMDAREVINKRANQRYPFLNLKGTSLEVLQAGGIIPFTKQRLKNSGRGEK